MLRSAVMSIAIFVSVSATCAAQTPNVALTDLANYHDKLETRSRSIFPINKEEERQKWIAERELQAMARDGLDYSDKLEAMSLRIFPWISQQEQRSKWMIEHEQ